MFGRFMRRKDADFLKLLLDQAKLTQAGLEALEEFARDADPKHAKMVATLEREEDELRRILIDELNRTFVTPIDREDIFRLSRAIDDVLDYANTTVDEMIMLGIPPTPFVLRMASVLREAAGELVLAVQHLKDRPNLASEHAVKAKTLENQAESLYREALVALFEGVSTVDDVVRILKTREVYRHLSNAADRGDEAANVIGDIVVKIT